MKTEHEILSAIDTILSNAHVTCEEDGITIDSHFTDPHRDIALWGIPVDIADPDCSPRRLVEDFGYVLERFLIGKIIDTLTKAQRKALVDAVLYAEENNLLNRDHAVWCLKPDVHPKVLKGLHERLLIVGRDFAGRHLTGFGHEVAYNLWATHSKTKKTEKT